ncbi:CLUMA_CG011643, isoform A [Clunio marinus]|uniref:CLUMA_CG011643, isoform A n=1 Tax=Clunio marinus TaxID=568069 RepID=A0A1J1IIJ9_9DIPT|nr:CLUMA_CG011643, isoform A [Clunio marinus]
MKLLDFHYSINNNRFEVYSHFGLLSNKQRKFKYLYKAGGNMTRLGFVSSQVTRICQVKGMFQIE